MGCGASTQAVQATKEQPSPSRTSEHSSTQVASPKHSSSSSTKPLTSVAPEVAQERPESSPVILIEDNLIDEMALPPPAAPPSLAEPTSSIPPRPITPCIGAAEVLRAWIAKHGGEAAVHARYRERGKRSSQAHKVEPPPPPECVQRAVEKDGGKYIQALIEGKDSEAWQEAMQPLVSWVIEAAAAAPYDKETKRIERHLLGTKMFVTNLTQANFDDLRTGLNQRMLDRGLHLQMLPPGDANLDLTFSMSKLQQPGRPARAMQGNDGVLPTPEGVNWDDPVELNERAYIYMLNLVALAIDDGFQARVRRTLQSVFGEGFDGHTVAPTKTYGRMVGKLISREDHRYETVRPRPMLNVDVVRSAVNVKATHDIEAALAALAKEFGGFVKEKNKYLYPEADLRREFYLRLILVSMVHEDTRTFGELFRDPEVQAKWAEFASPDRAKLEGAPKSRRSRNVARALQWLKRPEIRDLKVRMICECQVMTDETLHTRHSMHELFKVFRAPDKNSLFRDMDKAEKTITAAGDLGLQYAAQYGECDAVEDFLSKKADVNTLVGGGDSPLYLAAENGHPDVLLQLLKAGASINVGNSESKSTALHIASQNGHFEVVQVLMRYKADTEVVDDIGVVPLYTAALHGYKDVVECLLRARANPNMPRVKYLSTPLHSASQEGFSDVTRVLLEARANPDLRDDEGCTPLWVATDRSHHPCAEALLKAKADPNAEDSVGQLPLNQAALQGFVAVVELLVASKADVNAKGECGTPLQEAMSGKMEDDCRERIVKVLKDAGAVDVFEDGEIVLEDVQS